jgi:hypothetical protein
VLSASGSGAGEDAPLFQASPPLNVQLSVTQNESEGKVKEGPILVGAPGTL